MHKEWYGILNTSKQANQNKMDDNRIFFWITRKQIQKTAIKAKMNQTSTYDNAFTKLLWMVPTDRSCQLLIVRSVTILRFCVALALGTRSSTRHTARSFFFKGLITPISIGWRTDVEFGATRAGERSVRQAQSPSTMWRHDTRDCRERVHLAPWSQAFHRLKILSPDSRVHPCVALCCIVVF